jgi:hypothetical protein
MGRKNFPNAKMTQASIRKLLTNSQARGGAYPVDPDALEKPDTETHRQQEGSPVTDKRKR